MSKDYKKLYEEALERAKYLKENTDSVGAKDISYNFEYIFPELKESEDERIRKVQLNYWRSVGGKEWYGVPVQETIAWLEKQGEHNPTDKVEQKFKVGDIISDGISEVEIVSIDKNKYNVTNDEIENDAHICNWVVYFKDQEKWKLAEYNYSEENKKHPQSKQEWSEEDEEMHKEVLTDIIYAKNDLKTKGCLGLSKKAMKAFNWFSKRHKSLRPQSKWKPSEEQMEIVENLLAYEMPPRHKKIFESLYNDLKKI